VDVVNDLKFYEEANFTANMVMDFTDDSNAHSHSGSLSFSCHDHVRKLEWKAGHTEYTCETGVTYTSNGKDVMSFDHKTTWNGPYTKLSQDMTFKSQLTGFEANFATSMAIDFTDDSNTHSHSGSLSFSCHDHVRKLEWKAGHTEYTCETGVTYTSNGKDVMSFDHKTTWNGPYTKLSQDMTFKSQFTGFEDCESSFSYDLTQAKKTFSFTTFNDPSAPYRLNAEWQTEGKLELMIDYVTRCEYLKNGKFTVTANVASQPWDVSVEGNFNDITFTGKGNLEVNMEGKLDAGLSFESQLPGYENLKMSFTNSKRGDQYQPHLVLQWANDKKIEMSAIVGWSSTYKLSVDLNTPFDRLRSLVTDITVNWNMPDSADVSFEFKTNKMSEKLFGKMNFKLAPTSLSVEVTSPFEVVRSFELTAAVKPQLSLVIKRNGETIFNISGSGKYDSWRSHNLDVTVTYPWWNKYTHIRVNNDLSLVGDNSVVMDMMVEYMRNKEVAFKYTLNTTPKTSMQATFSSPFEKFENIKYSLMYEGSPDSWTENTQLDFYYGKVTTRTSFSMENGLSLHQTLDGQMKNGYENFNMQKDLVFTGNKNQFDLEVKMAGSFVPTLSYTTSWQNSPVKMALKATLNEYHFEYTHNGDWTDFTCDYLVKVPQSSLWYGKTTNQWEGNWHFTYTDRISYTAKLSCPHSDVDMAIDLGMMDGKFSGTWKYDEETATWTTSYTRSESPFKYEGHAKLEASTNTVEMGVTVTEDSLSMPFKYNDEQVFGLYVSNKLNGDQEYQPIIKVVISDEEYEFDGLYKNEGQGLVRNFKLHMTGPKGYGNYMKLKFELQTQSSQLVPGDAKFYLSGVNKDGEETTVLDMTSEWGNDRAVVTFRAPRPMKYTLDFSVDTKGQSVELNANWDTTAQDKNFQVKLVNRFVATSRRVKSQIDVDVVYTGISRGFFSDLDWKSDEFKHQLTFDYNGKEIGYNWLVDHKNEGCDSSLELMTEWRSVKATWTNKPLSDGREVGLGFYWDSAKDLSKKVTGTTRWEKTATNSYTWTTTFSHPALSKEITLTDKVTYNTSKYVFSLDKVISFSTDSSKDVALNIAVEKNGKWGVELKQDFNKIDMKMGTEFTSGGARGHFVYKATDSSMKNFGFESSYADANRPVLIKLMTPMKNFEFSSETTRTTWTSKLTVGSEVYQMAVTARPDDSYLLVKLTCRHDNNYQLECATIDNGYQMQLSRTEGGRTSVDALIAGSINDSRTVNGKLYWNPAVYSEVKSKIAAVRADVNDVLRSLSRASSTEAKRRASTLQLGSDFEQVMPHYRSEMNAFTQDMEVAKQKIGQAYDMDMFYMKSVGRVVEGVVKDLKQEFSAVEARVMRYYDEVVAPRLPRFDAEKMREELVVRLARVEERINKLKDTVSLSLSAEMNKVAEAMQVVADYLEKVMGKVENYVSEHPVTETLKSVHAAAMNKFNEASDMAYSRVSGLTDPQVYADAIYQAHDYMNDALVNSRLTDVISANTIRSVSDSVMYKLKYYYQYYDVADHVKMFIEHSRNIAAEYLDDYLRHYLDEALNEFEWKQYDLDNGRIEFEMNIPTRYGKVEFARIKANLKQRISAVVDHMAKYHFNMKEMFYMYKPQSFGQILPPFNAQAIIAGQHIRTFDRRHYDFSSGSCSYLLARDFQDGNFTVSVNYDGQQQSLTVRSNGLTVDIAQDNTVKLDGVKAELPFQHFNTTVTRVGHHVVVSSTLGVEVVCDNEHGLCTVEMSGYYFAKTGGLFGTYNNEPLDDFTTSRNQNVTDVEEFANSWTSSCTGSYTARTFEPVKGTKEYMACASVFMDSSSSLQPCFSVVDPSDAFHKCVNDMSLDVTLTVKNGPCKAAKFYEAECRFAGLTVNEPAQCVTCEMDEVSISQYESYQLPKPVMAADIVFVVEEKACNMNTDDKLPGLAKLLDGSLSRNGYTDIRYGLVGFGGVGVHEPRHVHTMGSKMFAGQNEFKLGTDALQFGDGKNKDVLEAVDFAAQYPFRSGATKFVIVVPCSDCSTSALSYRALASRLVSEDITLHVLNGFSYDLTVDGKNPENNYLFGIDNNAVYTMRDARAVRGNKNLYSITTKPTDSCSSLALQTGGTVFDLNMMTKMRGQVTKSFQTVFANTMALTAYPPTCTTCSCEYSSVFHMPRSSCRRC
jgi:hypothetical protein